MTDEAKALVERLRLCATHGQSASYNDHAEAADLIETQAREIERLRYVGTLLYMAGRWSCDTNVDEASLWEQMRDALGLPSGTETHPRSTRREP